MISEVELIASVAEVLDLAGWTVETQKAMDGIGLDVYAIRTGGPPVAIECKAYRQLVGLRTAREFASVISFLRESEQTLNGWLITTSGFTDNAARTLRTYGVEGLTFEELRNRFKPTRTRSVKTKAAWAVDVEKAKTQSKRVFVVMPFSEEMLDVFILGIRWAAKELGVVAIRADDLEHNGEIIDEVRTAIKAYDVIIGDTTGANANVCYEIGYAHALSKPTILICRKGSELPFDLQGTNHLFYSNILGLRDPLREKLSAALDLPSK